MRRLRSVSKSGLYGFLGLLSMVSGTSDTCLATVKWTGPFTRWEHRHSFAEGTGDTAELIEDVRYHLPLGYVGLLGGHYARTEINRLFSYRHRGTARDTARHAKYRVHR